MSFSHTVAQAADVRAPVGSAPKGPTRLANSGTTESTNSTALTTGEMATILVGSAAIRVAFLTATGGGSSVSTSNVILGPYARFDWLVSADDDFIAIEALDGSSAYEAHVWTSSGLRG